MIIEIRCPIDNELLVTIDPPQPLPQDQIDRIKQNTYCSAGHRVMDPPPPLDSDVLMAEKVAIEKRMEWGKLCLLEARAYINTQIPMDDASGLILLAKLEPIMGPLQLGMLRAAADILTSLDVPELEVQHANDNITVKQYFINLINQGDPS